MKNLKMYKSLHLRCKYEDPAEHFHTAINQSVNQYGIQKNAERSFTNEFLLKLR